MNHNNIKCHWSNKLFHDLRLVQALTRAHKAASIPMQQQLNDQECQNKNMPIPS